MFNRKSIYALNKKDPDAIVYLMCLSPFALSSFGKLSVT